MVALTTRHWIRRAAAAVGLTLLAAPSFAQTWPMENGSHDLLHSFQNPFFFSSYFHEGVDIRGWDDNVVAVRSGIVRYVNQGNAGGTLLVEVDTGSGIEADSYLHVRLDPWSVGDTINAGDVVGQVSTRYFGQHNQHHLHLNRFDGWAGGSGYVSGRTNMLHPLVIFPDAADRDPQELDAVPSDANEDGAVFEIVRGKANGTVIPFAYKRVDLLLEATDRKTSTLYWNQGLLGVGYWIESLAGGSNVRRASNPYRLVRFDDAWRSSVSNADAWVTVALVSDAQHAVEFGPDNTGWSMLATYILTNTMGTTGGADQLDAGQLWMTQLREGTATEPNGSDGMAAREIQETEFPDGLYVVHALTEDLRGEVDTPYDVVVDNFRPYVQRVVTTESDTGALHYDGGWTFDAVASQLLFTAVVPEPGPSGVLPQGVHLEIEFSEPVENAEIQALEPDLGQVPTLTSSQPAGQRKVWTGLIPADWFPASSAPRGGTIRLFIAAVDLNGSTLYEFSGTDPVDAPFNRRSDQTPWDDPTVDSIHVVPIGVR